MHSFGEMGQTGVHCHPAAVSRRPVSFLPTATDFARPIFALCPCVGRNSNGVVPLCPAAIRTTEVLAARFHFAFPVPVVDRVGGDSWSFMRDWIQPSLDSGQQRAIPRMQRQSTLLPRNAERSLG
jgi:hypothetical protein